MQTELTSKQKTAIKNLIKTAKNKLAVGENRLYTLKGVKNLSRADVEMFIMYAEDLLNEENSGMSNPGLQIETIFKNINIEIKEYLV